MKIYISIPITNCDISVQRVQAANAAEQIRSLGHEPVNPFDTPDPQGELSEKEKYAYYMGEDIKLLLICDAIYLSPNWHKSKGCKIEFGAAQVCGLRVFYSIADIRLA